MRKKLVLLGLAFVFQFTAKGQEYQRPAINLELMVQELLAQQEEDNPVYEDIYENLLLYYQNPINLNNTNPEELATLFVLTPAQIQNLFKHIRENGQLLSIYELQAVPNWNLITIQKILPFVTVQDPSLLTSRQALGQRIVTNNNQYLIARYDRTWQQRRGYTAPDTIGNRLTTRYTGSPDKYLLRYRNSHAHDFSIGFTAEKDAGEALTWNPNQHQYGADFYSAHLQVYNKGKLKALALGDYQLQFGQGLLLSSGFSVGKGSETITTVRRSNVGIRPYSSVLESGFFRGAAATYYIRQNMELTGFISGKRVDGALQETEDSLVQNAFSFGGVQSSGLHRTPTELQNKHQLRESIYGSNFTYKSLNRNLIAGVTLLNTSYNIPLQRSNASYNAFSFNGRQNTNVGVHYSYNFQNVNIFGETARSTGGGLGTVNGLMASLSKQVDVALVYRNYARNFNSFYGNAFGENTRNQNEMGWYTGLKIKPYAKWEITAYYDKFRFPWLKYRVNAPSHGTEYLVRVLYKPTKTANLYAQFRQETKGLNRREPNRQLDYVAPATRRNYLFYLDFSPLPLLVSRTRVQMSQYQHEHPWETGYYIGQEGIVSLGKTVISARLAFFYTDDYDTRQYVTERDVLSAFSVPAFFGTGTRVYLVVQQALGKKLDSWLKIAHTQYRNQETIGSGLEQISGPARTDIRCQVRYRF
ncbi:MAG: ComEA family DNA-binding protein [Adhaeribacter sp.]